MNHTQKSSRIRRAKKTRSRQRSNGDLRLVVHKSSNNIYAQIIECGSLLKETFDRVLVSTSTLEKENRSALSNGGNKAAAEYVGKRIAEKATAAGITHVAFDRSGFKYHGRVEALANAARANGLSL